jgi:hypothetical protein
LLQWSEISNDIAGRVVGVDEVAGDTVMQSRPKQKLNRRSKYAAQFDALRDSIEGDPSQEQIAELAAIIRGENHEDLLGEENRPCYPTRFKLNLGDCE